MIIIEPITNTERYLVAADGRPVALPEPRTLQEIYLSRLANSAKNAFQKSDIVICTQEEYEAIETKTAFLYFIIEEPETQEETQVSNALQMNLVPVINSDDEEQTEEAEPAEEAEQTEETEETSENDPEEVNNNDNDSNR